MPGRGLYRQTFSKPARPPLSIIPRNSSRLKLVCCTLTLNGEIAPQFTNFSLIDQMNQQLDSRADYYGSPLPRVAIAPSHTAPSQWRSSFLVDCTVEICLLLPIFAHLILNDPLRNARGNRGNRHFLTRPAREFFYHESPSIIYMMTIVYHTAQCVQCPVQRDSW